jgi:hypothetical protein
MKEITATQFKARCLRLLDEVAETGEPLVITSTAERSPAWIKQFAFRTEGRDVARPGCVAQGPFPGFGTTFPQLRADP